MFLNNFISNVSCSFFYTIQKADQPELKLCLTDNHASFVEIQDVEKMSNQCKFFYDGRRLETADKTYMCRSNKMKKFMLCHTKSMNSDIDIFQSNGIYFIQQGSMKLVKGAYDADTEGYAAEATETPANGTDSLILVKRDKVTGEVIDSESKSGAVELNAKYLPH